MKFTVKRILAAFQRLSGGAPATVYNTAGSSSLSGSAVSGFAARANALDARLTAKGV